VIYFNDNKDLQTLSTALKILSWVTLACQFNSGPGHQNTPAKYCESLCLRLFDGFRAYLLLIKILLKTLDIKRHIWTSADASVMHAPNFIWGA
jgi:hypothetical protein